MTGHPSTVMKQEMLGQHWENYAGTSAFGVLWRLSRLNDLPLGHLKRMLDLHLQASDNVFDRLTRSPAHWDKLANASAAVATLDKAAWNFKSWLPLHGAIPIDSCTAYLRICSICARSCYHTLLFQVPGINQCPWHGVRLTDRCPRCKRNLTNQLRTPAVIGLCGCGYDLTSEMDTLDGDQAIRAEKDRIVTTYLQEIKRQPFELHVPERQHRLERETLHVLTHACAPRELNRFFSSPKIAPKAIHIERVAVPASGLEDVDALASLLNTPCAIKQWPSSLCHLWQNAISHMKRTALQAAIDHDGPIPQWSRFDRRHWEGPDRSTYVISTFLMRDVLAALCASPFPNKSHQSCFYPQIGESSQETGRWYLIGLVYKRILLRGLSAASRYSTEPIPEGHRSLDYVPRSPWVAVSSPQSSENPAAFIVWVSQKSPGRRNS